MEPWIPPARPGGRPRKTDMREVVNAIFYLTREGCTWRALPHDFPPWKTVYNYFEAWTQRGRHLGPCPRRLASRRSAPAAGRDPDPARRLHRQPVGQDRAGGEEVGTDGGKKVRGRKRHIVVDTMGLLLAVVVTAANVDDARAAQECVRANAGQGLPALGGGAGGQQVPQPRAGPLAARASPAVLDVGGESSAGRAAVSSR